MLGFEQMLFSEQRRPANAGTAANEASTLGSEGGSNDAASKTQAFNNG